MTYGLYIHLPFCKSKCPYCSFASVTTSDINIIEEYAGAVAFELLHRHRGIFEGNPKTVYIGGGTPSLIPAFLIQNIVQDISCSPLQEFTIEANPESIDEQWLDDVLEAGTNRISIGVQSLDDEILTTLGRFHDTKHAMESIVLVRKAGFTNVSVDLIFGVPGQTMNTWKQTLARILELEPDHVSGYCLSVEEDTVFYKMASSGGLQIPNQEETADMYCVMCELLDKSGLLRYEISNFARAGYECKHNMGYWTFTPYLGIGSSAHSYDGKVRSWNESDPVSYIDDCVIKGEATSGYEVIDERTHIFETVMLSLRTVNGLDMRQISVTDTDTGNKLDNKIHDLTESGFLTVNKKGHIVLTNRGAVLSNEIIAEIVCVI